MHCSNCGQELTGTPEFCPNCGTKIAPEAPAAPAAPATPAQQSTGGRKSKTTSIVLAVFLAFFTWLYTYKKDAKKFWIGLGAWILMFILSIATGMLSGLFTWIVSLGIWIWAIVDTAMKKDDWYNSF
jgi:hypothetical protein